MKNRLSEWKQDGHLEKALYKILNGIKEEFDLDEEILAKILHRSHQTIHDWFQNQEVKVSTSTYTAEDLEVFALIELYDTLTSYFVSNVDQKKWLKTKHYFFNNESPIDYMIKSQGRISEVSKYLETKIP